MTRKVLFSFLGSSNYGSCKYKKGSYLSDEVRYIQIATLELLKINEWSDKDKIYILLTEGDKGSFEKNWKDNGHKEYNSQKTIARSGLKTEIEKLGLPFIVEPVMIKDGNSEEEIWEIFETIYDHIEENDELYIDITHGFRYLPMLSIVLSNYGKLLKNITVKSITYGNYESRINNVAPIIDLTSFSALQDWTNAANLFVNHGNLDGIVNLTKQEIMPVLKVTKGKDGKADNLRKLAERLEEFSTFIKVNNGPALNSGETINRIQYYLSILENDLITPLNPILERITGKISGFSDTEDVMNGFKAVDFCIESGLFQQGYTMLLENIITLILKIEDLDVKNLTNREVVSGAFRISSDKVIDEKEKWKGAASKNESLTKKILNNSLVIDLYSVYASLTDKRNMINHAGFNSKSSDKAFKRLKNDLSDLNSRVRTILENHLIK